MKEERIGKYTVRWHGIKNESGVLHSPDQLPEDAINSIVNVILQETVINIKMMPVDPNKDSIVYDKNS